MSKGPLKLKELLQRLKPCGVVTIPGRGKGSERILLQPEEAGSKRGPIFAIKDHGLGSEITIPVINAVIRRFNKDKKRFWK
jgi:hypothetical protein